MKRLCLLFMCVLFLNLCNALYVYIEEGKRRASTTVHPPVFDGFILTTERNIDVLEFRHWDADEDKKINLITNFPELKYINISYMGLEKIPKFLNLPKAVWLIMEKNNLHKISSNAISTLPLEEVYFGDNQITQIDDNSFGINIKDMNLACNQLTEISVKWFKNPEQLNVLGLENNLISYLDENLTQSFPNLHTLDLSYNKLISIGNGAFSGLSSMQYLNLQANQLTVLQPQIFGKSINISGWFNIGRNRLNFLAKDLLKKLHLKKFVILGNPWQCPCLREIEKWMALNVNDTSYETYLLRWKQTNPVCVVASSFSDQCVELVDKDLYNEYKEALNADDHPICVNA